MPSSDELQLYNAAFHNNLDQVRDLVTLPNVNVNAKFNDGGFTALYAASEKGHLAVVQCLLGKENANVDAANKNGATALYVASQNGHLAVVKCLVEMGKANIHATYKSKHTALDRATTKGHDDVVAYLKQKEHLSFLCECCHSFKQMTNKLKCHFCWSLEQHRGEMEQIKAQIQAFGEKLNSIGSDIQVKLDEIVSKTDSASTKINEIVTETHKAGAMLHDIGTKATTANTCLSEMVSVLGNLDMQVTNMVPRLFYIVPAEMASASLHPQECSLNGTAYNLYFVCARSKVLVDAPIKIRLSEDWVKAAAPALPDFIDNSAGLSHNDVLRRLQGTQALSFVDVPDKRQVYKLVVEKATEQGAWRNLMEPVRSENSPATIWVTKEVANDSSLRLIKVNPGY